MNPDATSPAPDALSERTLSERQRCELAAYNAAFSRLGFSWRWEEGEFRALLGYTDPIERVRRYIENHHPHLLRAYDAHSLAELVHEQMSECGAEPLPAESFHAGLDGEFRPL